MYYKIVIWFFCEKQEYSGFILKLRNTLTRIDSK